MALPMFLKLVGMQLSIEVCAFVYFVLVAGLKSNTHVFASDRFLFIVGMQFSARVRDFCALCILL